MVKQQSVHLKLDTLNYAWLQQYVFRTGTPRNRLINIAVAKYVRLLQTKQRMMDAGRLSEYVELAKKLNLE